MRKGFSILSLLVSVAALLVAVAAYMRTKGCFLCDDDLDDDILELYEDDDCGCDECGGEDVGFPGSPAPQETAGTDDEVAE